MEGVDAKRLVNESLPFLVLVMACIGAWNVADFIVHSPLVSLFAAIGMFGLLGWKSEAIFRQPKTLNHDEDDATF